MYFRLIYDEDLAQAAYLIGCQACGEAIVIDPQRDAGRYHAAAAAAGMRIVAAAETHVHADFVSGVRELAEGGAVAVVSGAGGAEWTPRWLGERVGGGSYAHRVVGDGDEVRIGGVTLRVRHTPGHTPEHVCYEVFDGGVGEPMGVCTGDFVFVGDVGRPDLLETAAGVRGAMEPGARDLWRSTRWFGTLGDHLQVWPGHGAGSACGKALGAVPQSTVGYEKRHNAALRAVGEGEFVASILEGQPDPPGYFARMKRVNVEGPPVLGALPEPGRIGPAGLPDPDDEGSVVVDLRAWEEFRRGHVRRSLSGELDGLFTAAIGSYVQPSQRVYLVGEPGQVGEAVRRLVRVGIDRFGGYVLPADVGPVARATIGEVDAQDLPRGAAVLDVRRKAEFAEGHAPGAVHVTHTQLAGRLGEVPQGAVVHVMCKSGRRSARASALLARAGFTPVNVVGGFDAYSASGAPVEA